jgi:hypothetical protein
MLINEEQDRKDDRMVRCILVLGVCANVLLRLLLPLMGAVSSN